MKKCSVWLWVMLTVTPLMGCAGSSIQSVGHTGENVNPWLSYSIVPRQLRTALRPAMWGNGQLELLAELDRPCVSEVVCFGFGEEGLRYGSSRSVGGEEHLVPAVYAAETGKKYLLHSAASSVARNALVTFRPDRQIWRYEFDDLTVEVSLILPRLHPGYLLKLQIVPQGQNQSRKWLIYHELRAFHGSQLRATEADYTLSRGTAWCKSPEAGYEAIGSTIDAQAVNLGWDGKYLQTSWSNWPRRGMTAAGNGLLCPSIWRHRAKGQRRRGGASLLT